MPTVPWLISDRAGMHVQAWALPMVPPATGREGPGALLPGEDRRQEGKKDTEGSGVEREESLLRSTLLHVL